MQWNTSYYILVNFSYMILCRSLHCSFQDYLSSASPIIISFLCVVYPLNNPNALGKSYLCYAYQQFIRIIVDRYIASYSGIYGLLSILWACRCCTIKIRHYVVNIMNFGKLNFRTLYHLW